MKVFTTGQVAKICKVAPRTVSKWFDSGRLKGYRIPGSQDRRIPREYLIKFLKEHGMPLGDLEDQAMAKVLIVAQDQVLIENLKRELPLERSFKLATAWMPRMVMELKARSSRMKRFFCLATWGSQWNWALYSSIRLYFRPRAGAPSGVWKSRWRILS